MRHLEEKHLLTAIYQQLKSDVDRVEQLESYVQDMNSETSRLTVIRFPSLIMYIYSISLKNISLKGYCRI